MRKVYGKQKIIGDIWLNAKSQKKCIVECICGEKREVFYRNIVRGLATQCRKCASKGRAKYEKNTKCMNVRYYRLWTDIKTRCYNKNSKAYNRYGSRGITIYDKWVNDFIKFRNYIEENLGDKPTINHSLDRINNNKGYYPGNLRWATRKDQARNTKNTYRIKRICSCGRIKEYKSLADAHDEGFNKNKILRCIKGERKTYRQYFWKKAN